MLGLTIRKLADTSSGERVVRFHPETGERQLVNPATGQPEAWPLAGVRLDEAPDETGISTTKVVEGKSEGWITLVNERPVVRPGGPANDKWRVMHTFLQADQIVFHTVEGDVTYDVTHQPDKYADDSTVGDRAMPNYDNTLDDSTEVTDEHYENGLTRVDWWYGLKKVNQDG